MITEATEYDYGLMFAMQKRKLWMVAIALCLSTTVSTAATDNRDLAGWSKARWGMTESEIQQAFGAEVVSLPKPEEYGHEVATLCIDTVLIDGAPHKVWFLLNPQTRKLQRVLIKPRGEVLNAGRVFLELEQLLVLKYGSPSFTHSGQDAAFDDRVAEWTLGSTAIRLNASVNTKTNWQVVSISYEDTAITTLDRL